METEKVEWGKWIKCAVGAGLLNRVVRVDIKVRFEQTGEGGDGVS